MRRKLSNKLSMMAALLSGFAMLLSSLLIGLIAFIQTEKVIRDQLSRQTQEIIREYLYADNGQVGIDSEGGENTFVDTLRRYDLSMIVADTTNNASGKYGIYRSLSESEMTEFLENSESPKAIYRDVETANGMYDTYTAPISDGERRVGFIQVARLNSTLPVIMSAVVTSSLFMIPFLILVVIYVGRWAVKTVLSPLEKLVLYADNQPSGSLPEKIKIPRDIDEEVAVLGEMFNKLLSRAIEAAKKQKEVTENISHELKTPLTRLNTKIELMIGDVSKVSKKSLKELSSEIISLGQQVDAILNLVDYQETSNKKWKLKSYTKELQELIPKSIKGELSIPRDFHLEVPPTEMMLVLKNLIGNAAKHNKKNGYIKVRAKSHKKGWTIAIENSTAKVSDSGNVFTRSWRGKKSKGHGLGLSITKELCEKMGIKIEYKNEKDKVRVVLKK